jgi:cell division protein FtsX
MTAMAIAAVVVAGMGLYGWLRREQRLSKRVERNVEWEALFQSDQSQSAQLAEVLGRLERIEDGEVGGDEAKAAMDAVAQLRVEVGEGFGKAAASYDEVRSEVNLIKTRLQIGPRVRVA